MQVLIVRHGIAEERGAGWEDTERPLTLKGVARLEQAVAGMEAMGLVLDRLYSSPWRRAVETAERVASLLEGGRPVETDALARAPDEGILEALAGGDRVGVVGHEPWMGELCAWLCTGERSLGAAFRFKKAGVALLGGPTPVPGAMELQALIPPRILRRLGRI